MRKLFGKSIGFIFLFIFIIWQQITAPQHIYADISNVALGVVPDSVTLGEQVTVTVNNIPNGAARYTLSEGRLSTQNSLGNVSELKFEVFDNSQNNLPITCSTSGTYDTNIWKEARCVLDATGNSFTFTAKVDTNQVGAKQELNTTSSIKYGVGLTSIQSTQNKYTLKEFVINAPTNNVTNTFDFAQQPFSPNPAKPGDELSIIINVKNEGRYTSYIQKYSTGDLRGSSKQCAVGLCTLTITIPNDILTSTIEVAVEDFGGYRKAQILSINSPNVSPTSAGLQVQVTVIPTPTPTIPPALLPCLEGLNASGAPIREDEIKAHPDWKAKIAKCTKIDSAIGPIETRPEEFIKTIFTVLLSMAGGWAVYLIITAGYQLMFSHGDPEQVKEAHEKITSAIVGLVFMILSLIVLRVIGVDIFQLPSFKL